MNENWNRTGVCDKNGQEGYNGDIWTDCMKLHRYVIAWNNLKAGFFLKGITIYYEYSMAHFPEGKIIGNEGNNPKLMKGKEEY